MFKEPQGVNTLMRKLLGTKFKAATFPHAREGSPRASNPPSLVVYQSRIKPDLFIIGVGMAVPARVDNWTMDEPREPA